MESEKAGSTSTVSGASSSHSAAIDILANGMQGGQAMRLIGHFESREKRFYQVIVMGKTKDLSKENVDMFMSSFKLQ